MMIALYQAPRCCLGAGACSDEACMHWRHERVAMSYTIGGIAGMCSRLVRSVLCIIVSFLGLVSTSLHVVLILDDSYLNLVVLSISFLLRVLRQMRCARLRSIRLLFELGRGASRIIYGPGRRTNWLPCSIWVCRGCASLPR